MIGRSWKKSDYLLIALAIFLLDQWSKWLIESHIPRGTVVPVLKGFLNLIHVKNTGVAFSLFATHGNLLGTLALSALGLGALVVIGLYFRRTPEDAKLLLVALSMILGGAVGNLMDRFSRGEVTDFIDAYIGTYHWYTFNVADSAITVGIVLMSLDMFFSREQHAA
jgi:signal peptidase II